MVTTDTTLERRRTPHPLYSRYRRPGERELDEAFFPVMWRADGYRTPWLAAELAARPALAARAQLVEPLAQARFAAVLGRLVVARAGELVRQVLLVDPAARVVVRIAVAHAVAELFAPR